jgi:hypothetical protein
MTSSPAKATAHHLLIPVQVVRFDWLARPKPLFRAAGRNSPSLHAKTQSKDQRSKYSPQKSIFLHFTALLLRSLIEFNSCRCLSPSCAWGTEISDEVAFNFYEISTLILSLFYLLFLTAVLSFFLPWLQFFLSDHILLSRLKEYFFENI